MSTVNNYAGNFTIDPTHSEIGFTARHAMVTKVRGSFTEFSGTASSEENLNNAQINVEIDVNSVDTRNSDRDGHLKTGDFFETEKYPKITFKSTDIKAKDDETLEVTGDLTIKDVTKPVTIDFEFNGEAVDPFGNTRVGFEGQTTINRKDFGLNFQAALDTGGVLVSEKITLNFDISAIKQ
ncbi:YceI family protein [Corynebacterium suicordis]|uniref:Polyisoprenoid-binding protein n=1 Tax=Corynebacterium suicordis DSM 45110 TaxID=1121369 RepID=A0ABR9ZGR6_9CORY|nr:YceI family protein [Corynebacterium suicordis]MBF4552602.1 polyisoprenoid-binding protein [Corynebacterium suicordis DSM 45110]MDR6278440.1 polyisoprenoid-binding protein YceI [Corynebacterium suicordis]